MALLYSASHEAFADGGYTVEVSPWFGDPADRYWSLSQRLFADSRSTYLATFKIGSSIRIVFGSLLECNVILARGQSHHVTCEVIELSNKSSQLLGWQSAAFSLRLLSG